MKTQTEPMRQRRDGHDAKPVPVTSTCLRQAAEVLGLYGRILSELRHSPTLRQ